MSATSIGRIVVPYLALVAACGAALAFSITHVRRESPVETGPATAASRISQSASIARDEGAAALITAQAEANAGAITLALSPRLPEADESVPVFDIARIERTGDAVIAGRAAPGAIVELLRGGEPFRTGPGCWAAGHCHFRAAECDCRPSIRRRFTVRRRRAQDRKHRRIPWRQPLAHQPCRLRCGPAICRNLQSESRSNPKSKSHLSRSDLCPPSERALRIGYDPSARIALTPITLLLGTAFHRRRHRGNCGSAADPGSEELWTTQKIFTHE